jgi:hypothetical protein
MARRRRGATYDQLQQQGQSQAAQTGYATSQYGAQQGYENAVEPTHNGNFAWNGQPIPHYQPYQGGPGGFSQSQQQQASSPGPAVYSGWQGQQASGVGFHRMPAPGSSGDPNAPFGQRNTGINNADARNVGFQGGYTGYGENGQPVQYGTFMRDGTQYGKGPHTIDPNKQIISAVRYSDGGISAVKFQDGTTANIAQAIGMAEAGLIEDVNTGRNREGQKTLRSYPDGDPSNNLSHLPRF